ncbi:hypothetical protein K7A41_23535 [Sphingobacterium sp. InxBP1]|uniref:hypothetical protein n=1 Tax=Sphingobacterium sp. InxBP1 TaxID=2870328 RepID=UPI0022439DB1|nr:hypothetical protein [Sphingobacterium sp. InxBP1]MCW8314218.1 hypothetical protein [Sphingobacterium sp. InxBP1]
MTEEELKNKVSYQNLLLYSLVLPPVGDDNIGTGPAEGEPVDMFDLFNGLNSD